MASPYLKLTSPDLSDPLWLLAGEGAPTLSGGDGGFEEVARGRRKSFTEWAGQSALKLDVALVLDGRRVSPQGVATVVSVESLVERLTRVSRSAKDFTRPPVVFLEGPAIPAQAVGVEWVVSGIGWGAADRDDAGVRVRQDVTLSLIEHVEPDLALTKKVTLANYKLVPVGAFRTLPKFSASKAALGKASRWKEIAQLNGIRGTAIPKKFWGKKLKVPRR